MPHPKIDNRTPFIFEPLVMANEEARPLFVPVVKATYDIGGITEPRLAEEQLPLNAEGEFWGEPGKSSYKYEPEVAFVKPSTDVVVIANAFPQNEGDNQVDVELNVGPIRKKVRVFGNRNWRPSLTGINMTSPEPFDHMPLIWELAFGGWDRSDPNPEHHTFEPRNPIGRGFRVDRQHFEEGVLLPNLEDPENLIKTYTDKPQPVGFGFVSPEWLPRAPLAGTYDAAWEQNRSPLLPDDFDQKFLNAAPEDQITEEYLEGDEEVLITNVVPGSNLKFRLPGERAPQIKVQIGDPFENEPTQLALNLDTVIINAIDNLLVMIWRANLVLPEGPHDLVSIEVTREAETLLDGAGTTSAEAS